jgi:hypothetical protein
MARLSRKSRHSETVALLRRELLRLSSGLSTRKSLEAPEPAALENWANEGGR